MEEILELDYENGEIEESKKLTTEQINALPDSDFALIQEVNGKKVRRFPIPDEAHVRNALARLPQAKNITEEEKKSTLENILKKAKELKMDELLKKYEKSEETPKEEIKPEEKKDEAKIKLCPECGQPLKDEETEICSICKNKKNKSSENTETEAKSDETKTEEKSEVVETKSEEAEVEVKEEEKKEEASTITTTQEKTTVDDIQPGIETITTVVNTEQVVVNDSGKEVQKVEEEIKTVVTYTYEQVQDEVRKAKEEKDKEIAILKTEIVTIKTELGQKNQEIETLKAKKEDIKTPLDLNVGNVEIKSEDKYKARREAIDKKAFGDKK